MLFALLFLYAFIDSVFESIQLEKRNKYSFVAPFLKMLSIWVAFRTMWITEVIFLQLN